MITLPLPLSLPLSLLITHFIADFLLQSDWMALNKSKWLQAFTCNGECQDQPGSSGMPCQEGIKALLSHVLVYSTCFLWMGLKFAVITAILHFITDAFTSKLTSKLWFFKPHFPGTNHNEWFYVDGKRHWFFVAIGFDQLLHYLGFALTLWMLA